MAAVQLRRFRAPPRRGTEPGSGLADTHETFFLEAYPVDAAGSGFQPAVRTALHLSSPFTAEGLPSFEEIVRAK